MTSDGDEQSAHTSFVDGWFEEAAADENLDPSVLAMVRDATEHGSLQNGALVKSLVEAAGDANES